jgi:hypothetical protein
MVWSQRQYDTRLFSEIRDNNAVQHGPPSIGSSAGPSSHARMNQGAGLPSYPRPENVAGLGCEDYLTIDLDRVDCRQVVAVGRILTTNCLREILQRQAENQFWTIEEVRQCENLIARTAVQVQGRIELLRAAANSDVSGAAPPIPSHHPLHSEQSQRESIEGWGFTRTNHNHAFLAWSAKLLALMLEKPYCALYQPLQQGGDRTLWLSLRQL